MALAIHTLSINPAFLQEIKDDHHELRQLMHHTAATLRRPPETRLDRVRMVELLAKLRDQLAMHFSLEEAYGYFEDAIREAPRLTRRAEKLRGEHAELYSQFASMVESAETLLETDDLRILLNRLAQEYTEFSIRFHEHEWRECDLILDALNEDLGTGD